LHVSYRFTVGVCENKCYGKEQAVKMQSVFGLFCLRFAPQPTCNASQTQKQKHSRPDNLLVVVVYRGFPATTTNEELQSPKQPINSF
jgi:hypothetical protein